ncbi:glycosyltransferase family 2 protein [Tersicoccus sp. MR15.9]|uniref:glycosyltransferase family 2 protein n=1 Tax=Tersicoccus mangrovi TaxID=3121635 RepID=UPI002FE66538
MHVTAVLVAHDGERYLRRTLSGLAAQQRPLDAVVAVDTGSTDDSVGLLRAGLPAGSRLVHTDPGTVFSAAVARGLADADGLIGDPGPAESRWIWLLHDDGAPAPDALARLLAAVETAPSVTIAGCKQVHWDDPRALLDVGVHLSRWTERLTLIAPDEQDQGQYDAESDVFAVNTAGMLIRRDVWDALGGFDPALPVAGDDLDLCWRNRLAGHRVVVVPRARIHHAADRAAARPRNRDHVLRRRAQVHLRLTHVPAWRLPFTMLGALLGALGTVLVSLLAKDPGYGATELGATLSALLRPRLLHRSRARAARSRRVSRAVVQPLLTPGREVRAHRRSRGEAVAGTVVGDGTGASDGTTEATGDTLGRDDFTSIATAARNGSTATVLLVVALTLAAGAVAFGSFFAGPAVAGGALLPLSPGLGAVLAHATSWWSTLGAGWPAVPDPFTLLLGGLALLGAGNGSIVVAWLFPLAFALSALTAWLAVGAVTARRSVRFWAALVYAAVPALQTALGAGRLGAVLAHVLLPLAVLGLIRAVGGSRTHRIDARGRVSAIGALPRPGTGGTPSWTAAAAAGLACAAVVASAPVLLPALVAGLLVLAVVLGRRARTVAWTLLSPLVLVAPLLTDRLIAAGASADVAAPFRVLLADPGLPLGARSAALWLQLFGFPEQLTLDGALPPLPAGPWVLVGALVLGVPALALAVAALFTVPRRAAAARGAWLAVLLGLGTSLLASVLVTGSADDGTVVGPYPGPAVSLIVLGLLVAAAAGVEAWTVHRRQRPDAAGTPFGRGGRITGVLLCTVLCVAPLAGLGAFAASRLDGGPAALSALTGRADTVRTVPARSLPATAADRATGPDRSRTLVLDTTEGQDAGAALVSGTGTTEDALSSTVLGQVSAGTSTAVAADGGADATGGATGGDPATALTRRAAATVLAANGVDPAPDLESLGAAFVVLRGTGSATDLLAARIDTVPGLVAVGRTDAGWLWRVTPAAVEAGKATVVARARLVDAQGATLQYLATTTDGTVAQLPPGAPGRRVVLAERADAHWGATVDGAAVASGTGTGRSAWSQSFAVPTAGGAFHAQYRHPAAPWWAAAQVLVLVLTLLLALPLRMPRRLTPHWQQSDAVLRRRSATHAGSTAADVAVTPAVTPVATRAGSDDGLRSPDRSDDVDPAAPDRTAAPGRDRETEGATRA